MERMGTGTKGMGQRGRIRLPPSCAHASCRSPWRVRDEKATHYQGDDCRLPLKQADTSPLFRGAYLPASLDDMKLGGKPAMPFSDARLLSVLNHTFWFLPDVASCYAMANLMRRRQNGFYHDYTINVCAGFAAGIGLQALGPVRKSMEEPLHSKSITLSCGKLTTGVTVKPWTGIFMLRNNGDVCACSHSLAGRAMLVPVTRT